MALTVNIGFTLTANSYKLHRILTLTTKRRCGDIKMNHSGASSDNYRLRVLTLTPSEYKKML